MREAIRIFTVEMCMPRSCSCSMKASRSEPLDIRKIALAGPLVKGKEVP